MQSIYLLFFAILTLGLFQGLLFSVLLVIRGIREERSSDFFLAGLLACGALILLPILLGLLDIHVLWNEWLFLPLDPGLLIGPLVYFFVRAHTNRDFNVRWQQGSHLIPFVIYACYHLVVFFQGRQFVFEWMDAVDLPIINPVYQLITLLSMVIYLIISIRHYQAYRNWIETEYANPEQHRYQWIRGFLWAIAFTILATCLLRIVETLNYDFDHIQAWLTSFMVAICTYYISIAGYMDQRAPRAASLERSGEEESGELRMDGQELDKQLGRLVGWMESSEAYLDPDLSLGKVARSLDLSRELVSAVINTGKGQNFRSFVNTYRVEAFKEAVRAGGAKNLTLFGLALECGFNSKATFNRVFKQIEGVTPNVFASDTGLKT